MTEQAIDQSAASPREVRSGHIAKGNKTSTLTKKQQLIRLLSTKTGVDIGVLSSKLGWQPHTTRAALSGLRKAGYGISIEKSGEGRPSRYRITGRPDGSGTAGVK